MQVLCFGTVHFTARQKVLSVASSRVLTSRDGPYSQDLDTGLGAGVGAAVVQGVVDGDVAVQGDGTQVHD